MQEIENYKKKEERKLGQRVLTLENSITKILKSLETATKTIGIQQNSIKMQQKQIDILKTLVTE